MNAPKAYTGKEKYIFISYSHRDTNQVYPIITRLAEKGYRVWYDSGIDPGTEWDENIAEHINECGYFIAFISSNYLGSNNCKDELNYARDLEKERLIVYLEDVTLPSGMAMRINRLQSLFRYAYSDENEFYGKLFSAKNIDICLDAPVVGTEPLHNNQIPKNPVPDAVPPVSPEIPKQQFNGGATWNAPTYSNSGTAGVKKKSKWVAAVLAFFFGNIGVHDFYLGFWKRAIARIVIYLSTFAFLYGVPTTIWAIIDIIRLLTGKFDKAADGTPIE